MKQFKSPRTTVGELDAQSAASLITAVSDIALIVDSKGVIRDLSIGKEDLALDHAMKWLGKPWIDTVTVESRPKVEAMLKDAVEASAGEPRWRQINHPVAGGGDVPVIYCALAIGERGHVVAIGRDLSNIATLQQRLVAAQQSMERDYSRLRHLETRYRVLFQLATDGVLMVDAITQKVTEANPAAAHLFGESVKRIIGRKFPFGLDPGSTTAVQGMMNAARAVGHPLEGRALIAESKQEIRVSVSLFGQGRDAISLVRVAAVRAEDAISDSTARSKSQLIEVMESAPEGFVVTDLEGRILTANNAFLELAQLATEEQVRDEPLERWMGQPGVDMNVLVNNLRQHGSIRLFATTINGEYGGRTDVEVSAVAVPGGELPCLGFMIRNVGQRLNARPVASRATTRSVEQLTELVGRVPLKELVRESTDVIEKLCIEAALELTGDNRASAADLLGLSRQGFYLKLRRYGLGDLDGEGEDSNA